MWAGFFDGTLVVCDGDQARPFGEREGFVGGMVTSFREDANGTLWIGSSKGLSRYRNGRFERVTWANGLPGNVIGAIAPDGLGNLWLGSSAGILRVELAELEKGFADPSHQVQHVLYDTSDGLRGDPIGFGTPTVAESRNGMLWFVTSDGVASMDIHRAAKNRLPPAVRIESVLADTRGIPPARRPAAAAAADGPPADQLCRPEPARAGEGAVPVPRWRASTSSGWMPARGARRSIPTCRPARIASASRPRTMAWPANRKPCGRLPSRRRSTRRAGFSCCCRHRRWPLPRWRGACGSGRCGASTSLILVERSRHGARDTRHPAPEPAGCDAAPGRSGDDRRRVRGRGEAADRPAAPAARVLHPRGASVDSRPAVAAAADPRPRDRAARDRRAADRRAGGVRIQRLGARAPCAGEGRGARPAHRAGSHLQCSPPRGAGDGECQPDPTPTIPWRFEWSTTVRGSTRPQSKKTVRTGASRPCASAWPRWKASFSCAARPDKAPRSKSACPSACGRGGRRRRPVIGRRGSL